MWPYFDGWCCAQGVDPRVVSIERMVHLGIHFLYRNTHKREDRDELTEALDQLGATCVQEFQGRAWHDGGAPSWWVDDDEAASSTLAATGSGWRGR